MNSMANAYIAYCAYRLSGLSKEASFKAIGPKYGDDGLDNSRGHFVQASKELGMKLKIFAPGRNVGFLGRVYLDVYTSDTTMSGPLKVLKRACVVNKRNPTAFSDRVNGYLVTDSHVPLVSDYLEALKRIYKLGDSGVHDDMEHDMKWRFRKGPFPVTETCEDRRLREAYVAGALQMLPSDMAKLRYRLRIAQSVQDLVDIKIWTPAMEKPDFDFYLVQ
jgi:hypothetical protein